MPRIKKFDLFAANIPFRKVFKHAAAERNNSSSIFVKCTTDCGCVGFGECLPRVYVTGETREDSIDLLHHQILPKLVGHEFVSFKEMQAFLKLCDGKAPAEWVDAGVPQSAAWCAVDLALHDTYARAEGIPVRRQDKTFAGVKVRFSPVISSEAGWSFIKTLVKVRCFGFRQVKLKVDEHTSMSTIRTARRILGRNCDIRVDANMAWSTSEAECMIKKMAQYGIKSYEQPIVAEDLPGLAHLTRETGETIMVDESLNDRDSLAKLIESRACNAVNVRLSKCGGLVAATSRCQEALAAGMLVQVGCQVGESSVLSAAQLALIDVVESVTYAEGSFGLLLLREDPATPVHQFGYAGKMPPRPLSEGLGVSVCEETLKRFCSQHITID